MKLRIIKITKYIGIALVSVILLVAIAIGVAFQFVLTPEKITPKVVAAINKNLNAELSIDAIELTFFKTFPSSKLLLSYKEVKKKYGIKSQSPFLRRKQPSHEP